MGPRRGSQFLLRSISSARAGGVALPWLLELFLLLAGHYWLTMCRLCRVAVGMRGDGKLDFCFGEKYRLVGPLKTRKCCVRFPATIPDQSILFVVRQGRSPFSAAGKGLKDRMALIGRES